MTIKKLIMIAFLTGLIPLVIACGAQPDATVELPDAAAEQTQEVVEVEPTATPEPELVEIEVPTETANTILLDYGFGLRLDGDVPVNFAGWSEDSPSTTQGMMTFPYEGVSAMLSWFPAVSAPARTVADAYNRLKDGQPGLTFEAISDGPIPVTGAQGGLFGGFRVLDPSGAAVGGGFVAGWVCPQNGTSYAMQVTGPDATVVQIRFQRLVSYFRCMAPATEETTPAS
tara:strand:+ start:3130 stop:3813 length:684 start_codon:yes stop_codon:yes gene_type:complete